MKTKVFFVIAIALLLCLISCNEIETEEFIGELVHIDGLDVSGMDEYTATEALIQAHEALLSEMRITVNTKDGDSVSFTAAELDFSFNVESVLKEAMRLSKKPEQDGEIRRLTCDISYNEVESKDLLLPLIEPLKKAPVDASAHYDPGSEELISIKPSEAGSYADVETVNQAIADNVHGIGDITVTVDTVELLPEVDEEAAKAEFYMLAEYTTEFSSTELSASGRVENIVKGAAIIDGYVLEPGKEFNINEVLGPRTEENGWSMAFGISGGRYVESYGGGICQVSTTLYNAALLSDLEITERHHHTWPMGYTDVGRDATITSDGLNLRFKNTMESKVLISAIVDKANKSITIRVFGKAPEDGSYIELSSKKIRTLERDEPIYRLNETLPADTSNTYRSGRDGCIAETYKEYYNDNGELIYSVLVSRDTYNPVTEIIELSADLYYARLWSTQ